MKHLLRLLLTIVFAICSGCAGIGDDIPVRQMGSELQYRGFTIRRPDDSRWVSRRSQQDPRSASFRLPLQSPTHTFVAQIRHEALPATATNPAAFKRYIDQQNQATSPRHELLSYRSRLTRKQGQPSVEYEIKVIDKAPANSASPLIMTLVGFSVIHPSFEGTLIDAHYSERGTKAEVDGTMDPVGRSLISGVTLQSALGKDF